jgi:hypothetical protein
VLNRGGRGGALLTLSQVKIESNDAFDVGGGLENGSGATAHLSEMTVAFNHANVAGGGIFNTGTVTLAFINLFANVPDNCAPEGSVPGC